MESDFTTKIQSRPNLSDVYFMTCLESTRKVDGEVRLAGTAAKIMLALTLAHGIECYAADTATAVSSQQIIPQLVVQIGQKDWNSGKITEFDGGKMSIEINKASLYREPAKKYREASKDKFERAQRIQMIMDSYNRNKTVKPRSNESDWVMKMANTTLCQLPYTDAILQYDSYDDVWQYNLFFSKDIELSVSVYVEGETIGDVDFNIYQGKELLVANILPLKQFVKKMKTVIAKVESNA